MSTLFIAKSRNPKSAAPKKGSAKSNATARPKVTSAVANAKTPPQADEPKVERVTKQERVLTLLSQSEGASIEEMMQATDWQQHSVRGFLAGTVKKKLGFSLTSLKPNGSGSDDSIEAMTERLGMNKCRLTSLNRLSYLAPEIVGALLAGRHPIELTPTRLLRLSKNLPHDWKEQRRFLGFAA